MPLPQTRAGGSPRRLGRISLALLLIGLIGAALISAARPPESPGKEGGSEKKAEEGPRTPAQIEKDLKQAAGAQNMVQLSKLIDEAFQLRDPAGYRAVITWALRGDDRELERKGFLLFKDLDDPAGLAVAYQEAVKNPNWKTRIILLAVAYQHQKDPAAFAAVSAGLRDPTPAVARAATRWLLLTKEKDRAVPPLIDILAALEKGQHGRRYFDTLNALHDLTGTTLEKAADWKNYWDTRRTNPAPAQRAPSLTQVVPAKFFSVNVESDRILFIIDTSGSMEKKDPAVEKTEPEVVDPKKVEPGKTVVQKTKTESHGKGEGKAGGADSADRRNERQRLFRVKQELVRTIQGLPDYVHFSVASFNNEITFLDEPPRLVQATPDQKKRAINWVKGMQAKGETWTDKVFEKALKELKDVDTIYLLSDGAPYRGGHLPQDKVLEDIKTLNRFQKCRIHTIGFKQEGDNLRQFLYDLAKENDGKCVMLP
jgi:hypothetical protein